jgi:CBS domain-containing protein
MTSAGAEPAALVCRIPPPHLDAWSGNARSSCIAAPRSFSLAGRGGRCGYTFRVIERTTLEEQTERGVAARVPALLDERLLVVGRKEPVTVQPGTSLADCLAAIRRTGTGDSVFVVSHDGRLLGVLTERDIFARLVGGDVPPIDLAEPVETLMTTRPHHLHLEDTVRTAIELMQTGRYRNVPLVDDADVLQGVIRPQDLLKYLAEAFPEELLNLPPRPHQLMDRPEGG